MLTFGSLVVSPVRIIGVSTFGDSPDAEPGPESTTRGPQPAPHPTQAAGGAAGAAPDAALPGARLSHRWAVVLVFGSSAAVLVVEIVALRLLAPHLGLTLETSTLVIGIALSAIALGSWAGGRVADAVDPRRLIGPALGVSGAVVAFTPASLRFVADTAPGLLLPAASLTILIPGSLLSAVTPMVTKLRLHSLQQTGTVVGQLSGASTLGAILGTVLTGFVLISRLPVSVILVSLGALLVAASLPLAWATRSVRGTAALALAVGGGGLAVVAAPGGCDAETKYHCVKVVAATDGSGGRTLVLDSLRHSYVDLDDPTYLEFEYVRAIAAVIDTSYPEDDAIRAYHLGGGGLTIPRYLAATRPGTDSLVSEIDAGVVEIDRDRLDLDAAPGVHVRVEDGRLGLRRLADDSRDLIVGDAFGGVSVPWHLTTREALTDVSRVLADDGVYVANLIDYGGLDFARAEVATLSEVFDNVLLAGEPADVGLDPDRDPDGGNLIAIASDRALDPDAIAKALETRETGWRVATTTTVESWVDGAQVLTDDFAPVDQLLQSYRRTSH